MSDGERIFTFRYASDDLAPTIFYRRAEHSNGWSIVSNPMIRMSLDGRPYQTIAFAFFPAMHRRGNKPSCRKALEKS